MQDIEDMRSAWEDIYSAWEERQFRYQKPVDPRIYDRYNAKIRRDVLVHYRYDQARMKAVILMQNGNVLEWGNPAPEYPFLPDNN